MKKLTALLLCAFFLLACCVTVQATGELTQTNPTESVSVTTTVPDGLALKIMATNVQICIDGVPAESFTISRQDTPTLELIPAEISGVLKTASKFLMVSALAAIGLSTSLLDFKKAGLAPMFYGITIDTLVTLTALVVIWCMGLM